MHDIVDAYIRRRAERDAKLINPLRDGVPWREGETVVPDLRGPVPDKSVRDEVKRTAIETMNKRG
jgi:hypothetical protein